MALFIKLKTAITADAAAAMVVVAAAAAAAASRCFAPAVNTCHCILYSP